MQPPIIRLFDSNGQSIKAGRLLGRGARGDVYALESFPNLAVKIYREPLSPELVSRLRLMVSLGNQRLLKVTAWPVDLIYDAPRGNAIGFVMPNFSGYKPIHQLFGVKSRLVHYPNASWPFLIHAAANTARVFSLVHEHGHIIGDVSSTNAMVSTNAIVALIDCDNYQILTDTDRYFAEGGTTGYVPSELIGLDYSGVVRTQEHDSFGLAVLIFQLLFMGRHPFSGTFKGGGEKDLDVFVKERRFSYGAGAETRQMVQPPGTLQLDAASGPIADLFERAFLTERRPKPQEWVEALERLSKSLARCDYHNGHYYLNTLSPCPWCLLERVSGVRLFNFIFTETGQLKPSFNLEDVWAKISAIRPPVQAVTVGEEAALKLQPSPEALAIRKKMKRRTLVWVLLVVLSTATLFALAPALPSLGLTLMAVTALLVLGKKTSSRDDGSLADSPDPILKNLYDRKKEAERIANHFEQRWREEAGEEKFHAKLEELKQKKADYVSLPALLQRKLHDLQKMSRDRQLQRFLDAYRIADAKIEDIGPDKKITLQAYGFETAADVKRESLMRVPGFSGTLSYKLVGWRQSLEQKFVFNPSQSVTPSDKYAVDQEIHSMRLKVEQELANGPTHLRQIVQEINAARESLHEKLLESRRALSQATLDLETALKRSSSMTIAYAIIMTTVLSLLFQFLILPRLTSQRANPVRETISGGSLGETR